MENEVERFRVLSRTTEGVNTVEELVAKEHPVTIVLNNQELVTLLCLPADLKYLAIGFLFSEGLLKSKDDIKKVLVDEKRGVVRVETVENSELGQEMLFKRLITSGCGGGTSFYREADTKIDKVASSVTITPDDIIGIVNRFQHRSELYLQTHGVHSAAIGDKENILAFSEDVGRHNAVDKVLGKCLLENITLNDRMLLSSGRISSEIVYKVAKAGIPMLISVSVPTNLGVRIADKTGITLIGLVRGKKFKAYANSWRIAGT